MKYINPFKPLKIKPIKISFNLDTDRDGVKDKFDCQPFNFWRQDSLSYEKFLQQLEQNKKNKQFIEIIGEYGIYKMKGPDGNQYYYAMNLNTGLTILNNYSSLREIINEVKKGTPQQLIQQGMAPGDTRTVFQDVQRIEKYRTKYGDKAFRFQRQPGQVVLDIGAGSHPDVRATHAIDKAKPYINFPDINYTYGHDLSNPSITLPYPNNSFHVVVSYGAIGRNFETPQLYKEIYRILKPSGYYETNGWWNKQGYQRGIQWIQQAGFRNIQQSSYYDEQLGEEIPIWRAFK